MPQKKTILAIVGSASSNSSNLKVVKVFSELGKDAFDVSIFEGLQNLPHFNAEQSINNTPEAIVEIREKIRASHGVLICTPEYVFSIPSGLKNLIEWCVSTTVFSDKPVGLITASAEGQKAHEELKLIMKTIEARFTDETALLIKGIKGKINEQGFITHADTNKSLLQFTAAFKESVSIN